MNKQLILAVSVTLFALTIVSFSAKRHQDGDLAESIQRGSDIYISNCITCHMENGEGIPSAFPPLAKSDYLLERTDDAIKTILNGATGEMVVNGVSYYGAMAAIDLSDSEVADVMNYIRNSWGNTGEFVTPAQVSKLKD